MKINVWIHKSEAISGTITKYYSTEPVSNLKDPDKYETEYVQVQLTHDEFVELCDNHDLPLKDFQECKKLAVNTPDVTLVELDELSMKADSDIFKGEDFLVEQYNRNRDQKDWIKTRDEIPYIYERNGEEVYRRREGDIKRELLTTAEFHSSKKPIKRDLKKLVTELQTIPGAKFADWWKGLTKEEQIQLTKFWE